MTNHLCGKPATNFIDVIAPIGAAITLDGAAVTGFPPGRIEQSALLT